VDERAVFGWQGELDRAIDGDGKPLNIPLVRLQVAGDPEPREREVAVKALVSFSLGNGEHVKPGDEFTLAASRARRLENQQMVVRVVDIVAAQAAQAEVVRVRLAAAARRAAPAPAQPMPEPAVEESGPLVSVKALRPFCVGAGVNCNAGDALRLTVARADYLVGVGMVEVVEEDR